MKTYRTGFLLALIGNIVLAVVLVGLWLHYRAAKPMADAETKPSNPSAQDSTDSSTATPPASTEARFGAGANLCATIAEHRREDRRGRT